MHILRLLPFLLIALPLYALADSADRLLFRAAELGDTAKIVSALGQGANVNSLESGTPVPLTPLLVAINLNRLDAVISLLQAGADPNLSATGETPLYFATHRDSRIVKVLLENGANPNIKTALQYTPLQAAATCQLETFKTLKKQRAYAGTYPNCSETVRLLLKAGANIDEAGFHGDTPISAATNRDNLEIIEILASAGANVNVKNNEEQTPLAVALYWYALEQHSKRARKPYSRESLLTVQLLLKHGADANWRDEHPFDEYADSITVPYTCGYTALGLAARHGWYRVAELLLAHGANPSTPRSDGLSPAELAEKYGHPKTATLIREYLAVHPANPSINTDAAR